MASKEYYNIVYGLRDLAKELNRSDAINTIDRLLYGKSYNTDIANLNDAYIIQTYIEEMLKKGVT